MDAKIEQGVYIMFCVKLGKSATETHEMFREAFGEHSLSQTAVFRCHSCFKAGRVSVEDDERSGRPSTSKTTENVKKSRELIHEDRRQTIHELADTVGISYGVRQEILCVALLLHHDNAPAHTSLKTTEFLTNNIVIVLHPPYSPDLARCDFAIYQIENETEGTTY
jgi:hypothetical protein